MAEDATTTDVEPVEKAGQGGPSLGATGRKSWPGQPASGVSYAYETPEDKGYNPQKQPSPWEEVGATGLAQYGGFVREEFLPQLSGDNALRVWREMYDNDPIVGAFMFAITMLMRKVEWRVEPAEASTVEEIVARRMKEREQRALSTMASPPAAASRPGMPGAPAPSMTYPAPPSPQLLPTPPSQPGTNPRTALTLPGTNAPAYPDVPGSNVGGGPAQAEALAGRPGIGPGGGRVPEDPNRIVKMARRMGFLHKAGSGDGSSVDGFDSEMGLPPIDPETGEPMEFPLGQGQTSTSPEAQHAEEIAVFLETCLHDQDLSWSDILSQIVTMVVFGFSYHEIVYKKRNGPNPDFPEQGSKFADGRIGWAKWAPRAQETRFRWEFGPHNEILGMWQLAPPKFRLKYLPRSKCLHWRTMAWKDSPEGRSVLRNAWRSWYLLKRIQEIEAIGVERDLAGLPVAKVPAEMMSDDATDEQKATLNTIKRNVRNIRRNEQEGIVWPCAYDENGKDLFSLELLASPSRRQFDTNAIISRYEQRIAMTVLADFILLGHEGVGARALGETKVNFFSAALEAWLDVIADEINTTAIPRLMQMNGEDPALSPRLTHGKLESISLEEVSGLITAMAGAGAPLFPDIELEDFIREKGGLPPKAASQDL